MPAFWNYRSRDADLKVGSPPTRDAKLLTDRLPRKVKRHFLECELKTATDLIVEYNMEYAYSSDDSAVRQKLIWLLERLQEEVL